MIDLEVKSVPSENKLKKPKLGFLGVGWIGRNRMEAIKNSDLAEISVIAEPDLGNLNSALQTTANALVADNFNTLLDSDVDGIVIATPSALHAGQCIEAFKHGKAVFCQKPLGRNAGEIKTIVEAAKNADKLLGVDLSYRHIQAMKKVYEVVQSGCLGNIFATELVFHNAYGPDKLWFYDSKLSGGGCVIDLGVHLIDIALWCLNFPDVKHVSSSLFSKGKPLTDPAIEVEDFAVASLMLSTDIHANLTCSWNLQAGQEAIISATFYGTLGGVSFHNINGSFYDFIAEKFNGTSKEIIFEGPDNWMGRAAAGWAGLLAENNHFNENNIEFIRTAEVLDQIYGR